MALTKEELERLAGEIATQIAPERTEVLLTTGEGFDAAALNIARAYMAATGRQRHALQAIVQSWAA